MVLLVRQYRLICHKTKRNETNLNKICLYLYTHPCTYIHTYTLAIGAFKPSYLLSRQPVCSVRRELPIVKFCWSDNTGMSMNRSIVWPTKSYIEQFSGDAYEFVLALPAVFSMSYLDDLKDGGQVAMQLLFEGCCFQDLFITALIIMCYIFLWHENIALCTLEGNTDNIHIYLFGEFHFTQTLPIRNSMYSYLIKFVNERYKRCLCLWKEYCSVWRRGMNAFHISGVTRYFIIVKEFHFDIISIRLQSCLANMIARSILISSKVCLRWTLPNRISLLHFYQ